MKKTHLYFLPLTLLFSCGRLANQSEVKTEDSTRIVCVTKQYNEIIFSLGAQKNIVGIDISSTYPPETKTVPTVGYHRALSAEAILATRPSIIIHDNNIGPDHVVEQLNKLNIPMKVFGKHSNTIEGTDSLIREIGAYFNKNREADSLCHILDADMKTVLSADHQKKDTVRVLVIHYGQASNQYLVMTNKNVAAKMVNWAGGKFAIQDEKGMKQISPELVALSNPDVILMTDFGYDKLGGDPEKIKDLPGVSATNAYKNKRIYRIEEHDLVYMGPRTGKNIMLIEKLIHQ